MDRETDREGLRERERERERERRRKRRVVRVGCPRRGLLLVKGALVTWSFKQKGHVIRSVRIYATVL